VLGWTTLTASLPLLVYSAILGTAFQLFITLYEEPALRRRFGEAYERYCRDVRRWIPRRG
jgi:protein-S-isoprenylcysteine O-methyltransferase Ste14